MPAPEILKQRIPKNWLYPKTFEEASQIQRQLAERVIIKDELPEQITRIGGVDVSNNLRDPMIYAVVVALSAAGLHREEVGEAVITSPLPYVPGYLAFREVPALVEAFRQLSALPDLVLVDGHGISHPRGLGIASHLGVLLDIPTIGVAKSILVGRPEGALGNMPGDHVPLVWKGRQIGVELRTKPNVKPVYVSVGHKISLETAIGWVVHCLTKYRLPEPTRQAHLAANAYRRQMSQELVR